MASRNVLNVFVTSSRPSQTTPLCFHTGIRSQGPGYVYFPYSGIVHIKVEKVICWGAIIEKWMPILSDSAQRPIRRCIIKYLASAGVLRSTWVKDQVHSLITTMISVLFILVCLVTDTAHMRRHFLISLGFKNNMWSQYAECIYALIYRIFAILLHSLNYCEIFTVPMSEQSELLCSKGAKF